MLYERGGSCSTMFLRREEMEPISSGSKEQRQPLLVAGSVWYHWNIGGGKMIKIQSNFCSLQYAVKSLAKSTEEKGKFRRLKSGEK